MCAGCGIPDGARSREMTTFVLSPSAVSVTVPDSLEPFCAERSTVASSELPPWSLPQLARSASATMPRAKSFTCRSTSRARRRFSDAAAQREHVRDEVPRATRKPALQHRRRPGVIGAERQPRVQPEPVEQVMQVRDADPHVAVHRPGNGVTEQDLLDERPCRRNDLHNADGACTGANVVLEARLLPGERPDEVEADPVVGGPAGERRLDRRPGSLRRRRGRSLRTGERSASLSPDDAVRREPGASLEAAYESFCHRAEVSVQRGWCEPTPGEQELKHRHVEADLPPLEQTRAEERTAEPAERGARPPTDDPVRLEPFRALEPAGRSPGHRPGDPVDRPLVEAVPVERYLGAGNLQGRQRGGLARSDAREHGHEREERNPAHGSNGYGLRSRSPPRCRNIGSMLFQRRSSGASGSQRHRWTRPESAPLPCTSWRQPSGVSSSTTRWKAWFSQKLL